MTGNVINIWTISAVALVSLFCLWRLLLPKIRRIKAYADELARCGYLAPPPTERATKWMQRIARLLVFIQVGRLKIVGAENLDKVDGPMIVTPNHPHWADTCVMPLVVNRPARYMAARGVFTFARGLGGVIIGPMGAFAADLTPGKGGPAREAAVDVVASGQMLVMFPEGWAYLDGKLGEFKKGAVRIGRAAAEEIGRPTYLVPTYLRYGKYPGSWIRKLHPMWEYLLVFLLFPIYRRGCTITIGEPISSDDLPADVGEATAFLKERVIALDPMSGMQS